MMYVCINILLIKLSRMWLEIEDTRNEDTRETLNQRTYAFSEFKRKEIVIHVGIAHVGVRCTRNSERILIIVQFRFWKRNALAYVDQYYLITITTTTTTTTTTIIIMVVVVVVVVVMVMMVVMIIYIIYIKHYYYYYYYCCCCCCCCCC